MLIDRQNAISLLEELLEEERPIMAGSAAHHGWKRSTKMAIAHIFGSESTQLHEFNNQTSLSAEKELLKSLIKETKYFSNTASTQLSADQDSLEDSRGWFWEIIHPTILRVAKDLFENGFYADSALAAFRELNAVIKAEVKIRTGHEIDGSALMTTAFSVRNPVIELADLSSEDGKNIQLGYMQLFAGSMSGIRNPKAHGNISIDQTRAIHFLFLASLLMQKFDERT